MPHEHLPHADECWALGDHAFFEANPDRTHRIRLPRRRRKAIEAVTGRTLEQLLEEATGGGAFEDLVPPVQ